MSATKEQLELFLFYLSETHTKSLSLHDLVKILSDSPS